MSETKLRTVISVFFIISHVLILLTVLILYLKDRFTDDEFTTTMGILVPALSALTTLAVTYAISVKEKTRYAAAHGQLSAIYIFTALLFPSVFVLALFTLVLMKGFDQDFSFGPFKLALGGTETIFAGYTGKVMASLFGKGGTA